MTRRSPRRPTPARVEAADDRPSVPLRLAATGGALGLELYEPIACAPLRVDHLSWSLPGLTFPVDLSGGVASFRNRRGSLEYLAISADLQDLERHLRHRLGSLALQAPRVDLWSLHHGLGVGLRHHEGALAFDLAWAPMSQTGRLVVCNARGSGDVGVPLAYALRVCDTLFGNHAQRSGRFIEVPDLAAKLVRSIAPPLGVRSPAAEGVEAEQWRWQGQRVTLSFRREVAPAELPAQAIRAVELATLCREADDQLAGGDHGHARESYMAALERAPRSAEIVSLIAQLDATCADRAEAALGLLVDCMPATEFGAIGAELLGRVGDETGALQAALNAASRESYAPVAAGLWCSLAERASDPRERHQYLNRAVAAAPAMAHVRWRRLEARLEWGDEEGVLTDAEHLEACAENHRARHEALARVGALLVQRGFAKAGLQIFERALRYVPDDPEATRGLAVALAQLGSTQRAATLLERSLRLSEGNKEADGLALLALAKILADDLQDKPQALARLSEINASSNAYFESCALQGRLRAALGDLIGASLSFARLREACMLRPSEAPIDSATWLSEAALFERGQRSDLHAAERHLAAALRLTPRDERLGARYRELARLLPGARNPS